MGRLHHVTVNPVSYTAILAVNGRTTGNAVEDSYPSCTVSLKTADRNAAIFNHQRFAVALLATLRVYQSLSIKKGIKELPGGTTTARRAYAGKVQRRLVQHLPAARVLRKVTVDDCQVLFNIRLVK